MAQRTLIHEELTRSVIGAFYEVYNTLGFGFKDTSTAWLSSVSCGAEGIESGAKCR